MCVGGLPVPLDKTRTSHPTGEVEVSPQGRGMDGQQPGMLLYGAESSAAHVGVAAPKMPGYTHARLTSWTNLTDMPACIHTYNTHTHTTHTYIHLPVRYLYSLDKRPPPPPRLRTLRSRQVSSQPRNTQKLGKVFSDWPPSPRLPGSDSGTDPAAESAAALDSPLSWAGGCC